jgi:VanZ family protein
MKKRLIRWGFVLIWMIVIFMFSAQNGETSSSNNRLVADLLNFIGIDLDKILGPLSSFIIRKSAHFIEYLVLYLAVYNALKLDITYKKSLITSLVLVFVYACSDEFHQGFVPGRGPSFRDVLVDTGGGALGMLLVYLRNK